MKENIKILCCYGAETYISNYLREETKDRVKRVRMLLNQGFSDVEICKELALTWDEFWNIFEKLYKEFKN